MTAPSYNRQFRQLAITLISSLDPSYSVGSYLWAQYGLPAYAASQGYSGGEGWTHRHLLDELGARVILSNYCSRPDKWLGAPQRFAGYGQLGGSWAGFPVDWVWTPDYINILPDGAQVFPTALVYALDDQHYCAGPVLDLATIPSAGGAVVVTIQWDGAPVTLTLADLANVVCWHVQQTALGEYRGSSWQTTGGQRMSDRAIARLLDAILRTLAILPLSQGDADTLAAFVSYACDTILAGYQWNTKSALVTPPIPDGTPYWNPVQLFGYNLPVFYWLQTNHSAFLSQYNLSAKVAAVLSQLVTGFGALIGTDAKFPWAVTADGVPHYFVPPNGDEYTPGPSVYTAARVLEHIQGDAAHTRSGPILQHWIPIVATDLLYWARPWFADEARLSVL
jgi:hypothetical protein